MVGNMGGVCNSHMTCTHWSPTDSPDGGGCALHVKTCSFGVCRACLDNTAPGQFPPAKGLLQTLRLGTHIKTATRALGIKPCGGCERRAEFLNGDSLPAAPLANPSKFH